MVVYTQVSLRSDNLNAHELSISVKGLSFYLNCIFEMSAVQ